MKRYIVLFVFSLAFISCDAQQVGVNQNKVEAYVVKKGGVENPNTRAATQEGTAGVLCIEGKMYSFYETSRGVGLAKQGKSCPDVQIRLNTQQDTTEQ
jgi:hypothetical protein